MVTTVLCDEPLRFIPIRSYAADAIADPRTFHGRQWKIWEAARAATAAPVYFRPLTLEETAFMDAGLGFNNPSLEVLHEVQANIREYKDLSVACFVSIGTGIRPSRRVPSMSKCEAQASFLNFLGPAVVTRGRELVDFLSAIALNPLNVHQTMRHQMRSG